VAILKPSAVKLPEFAQATRLASATLVASIDKGEGAYFLRVHCAATVIALVRRYFAEAFRRSLGCRGGWLELTQSLHLSAHP